MRKTLLLLLILLVYFQANAQIISYPKHYYGDGTNIPFDKEFDLLIPFKEQDSLYFDHIYLYKHKGNRTLNESIEKTEPPTVKLKASWDKNKAGDSIYLKIEFRYIPNLKEYSLLKPSGTYSLIFFSGITPGTKNIIKALRLEDSISNKISKDGEACKVYTEEREKQREKIKINTYSENFNDYIKFFEEQLIPLEASIKIENQNDTQFGFKCDYNYFTLKNIANLFSLFNGNGCIPKSIRCLDTCKVSNLILSLNKINCTNITSLIKGISVLSTLDKSKSYIEVNMLDLRRTNIEKSIADLYEINNLIFNLKVQFIASQTCKIQELCLDSLSIGISNLITELNNSKERVSKIIKLKSQLETIYFESGLFIDYDVAGSNTFVYNFQARNEMAITPVFGYAYYGFQKGFSGFTPYLGFQINFQGLNRDDPFNQIKRKSILQRTCFTTAWTLTSIQEQGKRYDLFEKSSLITGLGYKFNHVVMLNGGVLWFKKENPNVLVTSKSIATTFVLTLSLNLEIEKLLNGFTKLLPLK